MTLQKTFRKQGERGIASYSFNEIADKTGIVNYYGYQTGSDRKLSTQVLYSEEIEDIQSTAGPSISEDHNYDAPIFNNPQTLKGSANIQLCGEVTTDGTSVSGPFVIKIRKWDGTTATDIVQANSSIIGNYSDLGTGHHILNIPLTIPITHFKIGEQLRVTVAPNFTRSGGTTMSSIYGTSPHNLSGPTFNPAKDTNPPSITKLIASIPVKIDL